MDKKHTFVICAYKESKYLEECIQSLLKQKEYSNIILTTSTPNSFIEELCRKYNIPFFINEGETGITQDWEFAVSKSQTDLVTIAHQDDVYFEEYSKTVLELFERINKPLIFFTDYYELRAGKFESSSPILKIKRLLLSPLKSKLFQYSKFIRRRVLSFGNPICCPSVTYFLPNLETPIFANHFRSNEDWEAWEKFSRYDGAFVYINKPLMAHRIHAESETSVIIGDDGRSIEDFEMFKKFWPEWIARRLTKKYKSSEKSNSVN